MIRLSECAKPSEPVRISTTGSEVYSRFQDEPDTLAIAVVDDDHRPVGIIDRNAFFLKMGAEFGRALFAQRPVTYVMETPRIEDEASLVMDFMGGALTDNPAMLLKGFIIVDGQGRYLSLGTPLSLLEAGYVAANARVRELAELSVNLAQAEREALAASRAKSQFLATMSHEIRTPLNGVLAVAEIVEAKLMQEELRPYLRTILESGGILHRLLSDALELSRGEAGAVQLTPGPVSLSALAEETEALWRPLAESSGLALEVTVVGEPGLVISADGVRLRQVLNNIIGNAVKFTRKGSVRTTLDVRRSNQEVAIAIEVADTGQGIDAACLERIFEPFAKANEHQGGAGLGLSICRQIITAMNGQLQVRSTLGEGSVFSILLQLPEVVAEDLPAAESWEPASVAAGSGQGHVLIVDDNETNRLVAGAFMDMAGFSWVSACNGQEALDRAGVEGFDLILMDIKMPVMDGVAAARAIRAGGGPNRITPILAVTANADPLDAVGYIDAGMSGVVAKPLNAERLFAAISAAADEDQACSAAA